MNVKVDREERPDVDAIYMDAVAGHDRPRRLADDRVPHPDGRAVLRRHLLPAARPAAGMPRFPDLCRRIDELWRNRRDELDEQAAEHHRGHRHRRAARARRPSRPAPRSSTARPTPLLRQQYDQRGAASAAHPSSRRRCASTSCCATTRRTGDQASLDAVTSCRSTPWRRAASTTTSAAGSPATPSTRSGSCPTSRRCSTTTPCSPGCTSTPGRSPASPGSARRSTRPSTTCCATCATPTAASTPPRTPTARARRASSTSGRSTRSRGGRTGADADAAIDWYGVDRRRQLRGHQHPRPPGAGRPAAARGDRAGAAAPCSPSARPAIRPGLDDKVLTEWNALVPRHAGRGRRRHRQPEWARRRRDATPSSCSPTCAATTAAGCAPGRPDDVGVEAGEATSPTPPTTAPSSTPSSAWPSSPARPAGSTRPVPVADGADRALLGRRARRRVHHRHRRRGARHPAQGRSWTTPPRRPTAWPPSACCASAPSPATRPYRERAEAIVQLLGEPAGAGALAFGHLLLAAELLGVGTDRDRRHRRPPDLLDEVARHYLPLAVPAWGERNDSPLWEGRRDRRRRPGLRLPGLRLRDARHRRGHPHHPAPA